MKILLILLTMFGISNSNKLNYLDSILYLNIKSIQNGHLYLERDTVIFWRIYNDKKIKKINDKLMSAICEFGNCDFDKNIYKSNFKNGTKWDYFFIYGGKKYQICLAMFLDTSKVTVIFEVNENIGIRKKNAETFAKPKPSELPHVPRPPVRIK